MVPFLRPKGKFRFTAHRIMKRAASVPLASLSSRPVRAQLFSLLLSIILIGAFAPAAAQSKVIDFSQPTNSPPKPMTVDDVIKLSKAGLSDDVIIAQIKKRPQPFDLSTDQLIQLKSAHVSDRVIQAIMGAQLTATPPSEKSSAQGTSAVTDSGSGGLLSSTAASSAKTEAAPSDSAQQRFPQSDSSRAAFAGQMTKGLSGLNPGASVKADGTRIIYQLPFSAAQLERFCSSLSAQSLFLDQLRKIGFTQFVCKNDRGEGVALDLASQTAAASKVTRAPNILGKEPNAQLTRTHVAVLGSLTDFVDRGAVTVAYVERSDEAIPFTGITIAIRDSSNEYVHGTVSITPQQLPAVIDNLERLYSESATANDDLKYENETLHFLVDVNPHDWVKLGIFGDGALAGKTCRSVDGCRKTLRKFIDMLKAGQTMLHQQ
jgi:hypothetical protein